MTERKLAAIMFTDLVGYTALMAEDEGRALRLLQKNRKLLKPLIKRHHGEWLKEIGDGTLSSFSSAVQAVNCALDIQRTLKDDAKLRLRIGIHVGDVVFSEGDVFGDGVNVASRIEPLAEPGGICISERVYEDIRNKPDIKTERLGKQTLKGVRGLVTVYTLVMEEGQTIPAQTGDRLMPSIAVLPFTNMSADKENEYFCDGMTEELIDALAKIEGLKVVARTSAFQFKEAAHDIREVGRQLGVRNVLEGSVRKADNRLRITAQLINVADGYHLWSEKYDRELEDVFAIQDDIARMVVNALEVRLVGDQRERLVGQPTENMEAHNLVLKGSYHWNKQTPEGFQAAIAHFEQATELDPHYAQAYARLADAHLIISLFGGVPPKEAIPRGKDAAYRALEIDDSLPDAHASLAFISALYDWDWERARGEFKKAMGLKPKNSAAHLYHALFLLGMAEFEPALAALKRAVDLDPLSLPSHTYLGWGYYFSGQVDQAIAQLEATLDMEPNYFEAHHFLGIAYERQGRRQEALAAELRAVELVDNPQTQMGLGFMYGKTGQRDEARHIIEELEQTARQSYVPAYYIAIAYLGLDELDRALHWLERGCEERGPQMPFIAAEPVFDPLREEPRFQALLKKMNLN